MKERKTVKCPHCGEELTKLLNVQSGEVAWWLDVNGEYEQHDDFFIPDVRKNDFVCPECNAIITIFEEEAIAFLKGENI